MLIPLQGGWRLHRKQLQGEKKKKLCSLASQNHPMVWWSHCIFFFLCMINMHSSLYLSIETSFLKLFTPQIFKNTHLCWEYKWYVFTESSFIHTASVILCFPSAHILSDKSYAHSYWLSLAEEIRQWISHAPTSLSAPDWKVILRYACCRAEVISMRQHSG